MVVILFFCPCLANFRYPCCNTVHYIILNDEPITSPLTTKPTSIASASSSPRNLTWFSPNIIFLTGFLGSLVVITRCHQPLISGKNEESIQRIWNIGSFWAKPRRMAWLIVDTNKRLIPLMFARTGQKMTSSLPPVKSAWFWAEMVFTHLPKRRNNLNI